MIKRVICKILGHRLIRVLKSVDGSLECLACHRCKRRYAMHHPSKWFGEWDHEDTEVLMFLGVANDAGQLTPGEPT